MPSAPGIEYRGDQYAAQAGQQVASSISSALTGAFEKYEEKKKQKAFNDTTFDYIAKSFPGAVPAEALEKYHTASANEQNGMVLAAQKNMAMQAQQQQAGMQQQQFGAQQQQFGAEMALKRDQFGLQQDIANRKSEPFQPRALSVKDPVTGEDFSMVQNSPNSVVPTPSTKAKAAGNKDGDSIEKVNSEIKSLTGVGLSELTNATDRQFTDDGYFVAKAGGAKDVFGTEQASQPVKIPAAKYNELVSRYQSLTGDAAKPPTATKTAPSAALARARAAIAAGAPKDAVAARLQQMGIDPTGL